MNRYELMFSMLGKVVDLDLLQKEGYLKYQTGAYMPLSFDLLAKSPAGDTLRISMAHNYVQNGDVMADPDMELRVNLDYKTVEALSFQQDGLPGVGTVYRRVYPDADRVNLSEKKGQNAFLWTWLCNLKAQGFRGLTPVVKGSDTAVTLSPEEVQAAAEPEEVEAWDEPEEILDVEAEPVAAVEAAPASETCEIPLSKDGRLESYAYMG